ncbi:MAG TPA: prepilin-type N-terminal cleavage/methylation domain-containing protein [bacterium]|nr:prepilin-type N-terminal cleavage/methylation domain-containing protein [bacterium]HPO10700.1 prepilin-type N-terminal cleavage/methylation domain-containing protein [bacterium]HQO33545.1 prepilin-type N-terminal cleavage/methylation domain-containing protein [bacterium]HQP99884.1 prepilin-type N-terminal cleavage/methylation domain-containing protein [bacterium]
MHRQAGFTLIELLIVVAIIGILAAIAVPNFINAQTRAKLARCEADMKSLETAIESYKIDNNEYIGSWRLCDLTTPVAYMPSIPEDPFGPILESDWGSGDVLKAYGAPLKKHYIFIGPPTFDTHPAMIRYNIKWVLTALGPDRGWFDGKNLSDSYPRYSTSNGLTSRGNIERIGPGNIPQKTYRDNWDNKPG